MSNTSHIKIEIDLLDQFVTEADIRAQQNRVSSLKESLLNRSCKGNNFLGWLDLPEKMESQIAVIQSVADEIREKGDHLISIGIGGSYLGARSAIDFLSDAFHGNDKVIYAGHHIGSDYIASLLNYIEDKDVYLNVISKSGTTTEPAIAYRLLRKTLEKKYSGDELSRRIIATTDSDRGVIRQISDDHGYRSFVLDDDIGGRFSVLSPVGLLPIAAAGFDIKALLAGARDMAELCRNESDILANPALLYATARNLLYEKGKLIEILSSFEPAAQYLAEWWKQLFGESEGKQNKGIYPTSANLTTDLHSLGQFMQEGTRAMFETFLILDKPKHNVTIPPVEGNHDQLNYLAGDTVAFVNEQAYNGTKFAHYDGGLPNMTIRARQRDEYTLGQLFYFFEFSVAISGLMLDVNPFDQPGVEAYKQNMFALLNRPGFEEKRQQLLKQIKGE